MKIKRIGVGVVLGLLFLVVPLGAFKLTDAHQKEINEKKEFLAKNPRDAHAHFDLAMTYAYSNMVQEGLDELKKVNELDPEFAKKAQKIYRQKLLKDPLNWKLKFRLAFALFFDNQKKESIKKLAEILEQDPSNIWPYGYMALAYGEMGDYDKAIELCQKALKIDPKVSAIQFALGQAYYKQGKKWKGFWHVANALRLKAFGH